MKISEALSRVDNLKPNAYDRSSKISWLSTLDSLIKINVIDTHESGTDEDDYSDFCGYSDETSLDTELIAKAPYDEMYLHWMSAKIDYYDGEYERYNNSVQAYNDIYRNFAKNYNRTHLPKANNYRY